jgi:benzoyl-CoA 2,3-dioxygenase component A
MTAESTTVQVLRQHLIDPEICIRCNTCEETCPVDAITHDSRNYVVDPAICNACNACISPCPTGAIDSWRQVERASAYSLAEQLSWDTLPAQEDVEAVAAADIPLEIARITAEASAGQGGVAAAPWSAAHPYVNLHTLAKPAVATVTGNHPLTGSGASSDIRHIVLDFGAVAFPVLEGQTLGIVPPGTDSQGRPHLRAAVFGGEPARRRAPALQQRGADGEARDRRPHGPARRWRRVELSVRPSTRARP